MKDESKGEYVCEACGAKYSKPEPRCLKPECRRWHTICRPVEWSNLDAPTHQGRNQRARATAITDIDESGIVERFSSGCASFDRVLGGGIVPGATMLMSGEPGIGKSTKLLRSGADMAELEEKTVLYVTAEEEEVELCRRARRIDAIRENLHLLATKQFSDVVVEVMELQPDVLILDSLSNMVASRDGQAGSVSEIKKLTSRVDHLVKLTGGKVAVFIVAHVTKDMGIAGPKSMQHMFDATFFLESTGDLQTLRALKNRYGALESALFEMTARGIEAVENPSARFLADRVAGRPGSMVGALCDTNSQIARSSLFEVQALVGKPKLKGQRFLSCNGVDEKRLAQTLSVLEHALSEAFPHLETLLGACDVRVNIPGGLQAREPSIDLPVALAVASSLLALPLHPQTVAFGEVGLAGEVRSVPRSESRHVEAFNMGFSLSLAPRGAAELEEEEFQVLHVATLAEALGIAFDIPEPKPTKSASKPKTKPKTTRTRKSP